MVSLEENREMLASLNCIPVGISVDSRPCKQAWATSLGITKTPLLCDFWPHGAVAQKYGIFRDENGFSERANVIVDEKQKVVFVKIYPVHSVPDIGEIITFLQKK
jgi:peroxiredoxin